MVSVSIRLILLLIISCPLSVFSQEGTLKIADSLYTVGKYNEAIDILKKIDQKSDKVYLKLATIQRNKGMNTEALKNYEIALENNPDRILPAIDYGELLLTSNKLNRADSVFKSLTERYPDNAGFRYRLGLVHEKQQDSTAMDDFFKSLELDSTHQGALYKTAKFQLQKGKHFEAAKLAKTGLKVNPDNVSLLSILGQSYSTSFQFEKAIEPFEKLIALGEESEFILEKLGRAYRALGRTKSAIRIYKMMLEINDMNSAVHSNLGAQYIKLDEIEKAQQHFTMALLIKKQPVDREFLNIGLTFKMQKDYKNAIRNFEMALEENPDNERAMLERAIAADAYFEDKGNILNYYQQYLDKYEKIGNERMIEMAKFRKQELQREIHLAE